MTRVVMCKREHIDAMKGRTIESIVRAPNDLSTSIAILVDDRVIGAGGLSYVWEDCYHVWAVLTPECVRDYKVTLHKTAKTFKDDIVPKFGIKRMTALIVAGYTTGVEWAEVFGFEYEAYLPNYGPGASRDYVQMRWLWRD